MENFSKTSDLSFNSEDGLITTSIAKPKLCAQLFCSNFTLNPSTDLSPPFTDPVPYVMDNVI